MKRRYLMPLAVLLTVVALSTSSMAEEEETPLGQCMEKISDSFKTISRALRNPSLSDVSGFAGNVQVIKENATKAKDFVPQLIEESGDQKPVLLEAFRKTMGEFIATVGKLEKAVAANDVNQTRALVNQLNETRKKAHEKFKKPDEDEGRRPPRH